MAAWIHEGSPQTPTNLCPEAYWSFSTDFVVDAKRVDSKTLVEVDRQVGLSTQRWQLSLLYPYCFWNGIWDGSIQLNMAKNCSHHECPRLKSHGVDLFLFSTLFVSLRRPTQLFFYASVTAKCYWYNFFCALWHSCGTIFLTDWIFVVR